MVGIASCKPADALVIIINSLIIIPPYGSMGILSLLCVILFVCYGRSMQ